MNRKLKRVLSIIALVCMCIFVVLLPFWFVNNKFMGEYSSAIVFFFLGIGVLIFLTIYFFKAFPSQQAKEDERKKLEQDYYAALQKESDEKQKNNEAAEALQDNATNNLQDNPIDKSSDNSNKGSK